MSPVGDQLHTESNDGRRRRSFGVLFPAGFLPHAAFLPPAAFLPAGPAPGPLLAGTDIGHKREEVERLDSSNEVKM